MIEVSQWTELRPMDRIIVEHDGGRRVAQVDSWAADGRVRVRLHKKGRMGFCCGTICKRRAEVVDVTRCDRLNIKRGSTSIALVLAGGVA